MTKCLECGSAELVTYTGSLAFHPGGLTVRCDATRPLGSEPCGWAIHLTREEMLALAVAHTKPADSRERIRYELRRDTTRREPGEFVIARVGFSGAYLMTDLGRWTDRAEAEAALAAYLKNQEVAA